MSYNVVEIVGSHKAVLVQIGLTEDVVDLVLRQVLS